MGGEGDASGSREKAVEIMRSEKTEQQMKEFREGPEVLKSESTENNGMMMPLIALALGAAILMSN